MIYFRLKMPEEQKSTSTTAGNVTTAAENGTGVTHSPSKSPMIRGKMALAKITLLDGTTKDFSIEVIFINLFSI